MEEPNNQKEVVDLIAGAHAGFVSSNTCRYMLWAPLETRGEMDMPVQPVLDPHYFPLSPDTRHQ